MKFYTILVLFLLIGRFGCAQQLERVDSIVKTYPGRFLNSENLAQRISKDFKTDLEKVRAIYTWIARNVAYVPSESGKFSYKYTTENDRLAKQKIYHKKLSNRVVLRLGAVCEGYSVLFYRLCTLVGVASKIVTGTAKTDIRDIGNRRIISNHAWNIVTIDHKKYLVDVTWGAGYYTNRFVRKVDYSNFMANPKVFINKHYPDNYRDSLLSRKLSKSDFLNSPILLDLNYKMIAPLNGILNLSDKEYFQFVFYKNEHIRHLGYVVGTKQYNIKNFSETNKKIEFQIETKTLKSGELIIYVNYNPVVGYKVI